MPSERQRVGRLQQQLRGQRQRSVLCCCLLLPWLQVWWETLEFRSKKGKKYAPREGHGHAQGGRVLGCLASIYSLGVGKSRLSFKQPNLFPSSSRAVPVSSPHPVSFQSDTFPRLVPSSFYGQHFGSFCARLMVLLCHSASTEHVLSKRNPPALSWLLPCMHSVKEISLGHFLPPHPIDLVAQCRLFPGVTEQCLSCYLDAPSDCETVLSQLIRINRMSGPSCSLPFRECLTNCLL